MFGNISRWFFKNYKVRLLPSLNNYYKIVYVLFYRIGIGIQEHACIDLPGIKGMWSLKVGIDDSVYENTLVLAFVGHTRILTLTGEEVEETDIPGFLSDQQTFHCANVDYDQVLLYLNLKHKSLN